MPDTHSHLNHPKGTLFIIGLYGLLFVRVPHARELPDLPRSHDESSRPVARGRPRSRPGRGRQAAPSPVARD